MSGYRPASEGAAFAFYFKQGRPVRHGRCSTATLLRAHIAVAALQPCPAVSRHELDIECFLSARATTRLLAEHISRPSRRAFVRL